MPIGAPPRRGGYFKTRAAGQWITLPSGSTCSARVRRSPWEPRAVNNRANHTLVDPVAVHRSFAARPLSGEGGYDPRWDSWLLPRVDGQFSGTTDEIFQWAACKWGLSDDLLRAAAVSASTWYQYAVYRNGHPVINWGSGEVVPAGTRGSGTYCAELAKYGYDYQVDFGAHACPRTFSLVGVMAWQAPSWGQLPGNQNGTFPFSRDSTAFAVDYFAAYVRGCYNGWVRWLKSSGDYRANDIWGCVGAWYAGRWHTAAADDYTARVQSELQDFTWLRRDWFAVVPPCNAWYGCLKTGR
jgi:hypothetical protein